MRCHNRRVSLPVKFCQHNMLVPTISRQGRHPLDATAVLASHAIFCKAPARMCVAALFHAERVFFNWWCFRCFFFWGGGASGNTVERMAPKVTPQTFVKGALRCEVAGICPVSYKIEREREKRN